MTSWYGSRLLSFEAMTSSSGGGQRWDKTGTGEWFPLPGKLLWRENLASLMSTVTVKETNYILRERFNSGRGWARITRQEGRGREINWKTVNQLTWIRCNLWKYNCWFPWSGNEILRDSAQRQGQSCSAVIKHLCNLSDRWLHWWEEERKDAIGGGDPVASPSVRMTKFQPPLQVSRLIIFIL